MALFTGGRSRISKNLESGTEVTQVSSVKNKLALLHIVNSHNNERMFFADRVVLVEGIQDRIVFEALIDYYRTIKGITEIIEVLEVHGKGNFEKYVLFLSGLSVPISIIADFDFLYDIDKELITKLAEPSWRKIDDRVLKSKKSEDRMTLAEQIDKAIATCDCTQLKKFWDYVKGRHIILRSTLSEDENNMLSECLTELRSSDIFILGKGEIEDYLPTGYKQLEDTIMLLHERFEEWLRKSAEDVYLQEIQDIVFKILGIPEHEYEATRNSISLSA